MSTVIRSWPTGVGRPSVLRRRVRWIVCLAGVILAVCAAPGAAQQGWIGVVDEVGLPAHAVAVRAAVDGAGRVTAVWTERTPADELAVMASRTTATPGMWSRPVPLGPSPWPDADVAVAATPDGGALVIWTAAGVLYASRYAAADDSWNTSAVASAQPGAVRPRVAVGPSGDAVAAWYLDVASEVHVIRYDRSADAWSAAVALGAGVEPEVTMDDAGNALVVWCENNLFHRVMAARFTAAVRSWATPVELATTGSYQRWARVVTDAAGNATAVWAEEDQAGMKLVRLAGFSAATGAWTVAGVLGGYYVLDVIDDIALAATPGGDVAALWSTLGRVTYRRFAAATGTWSAAAVVTLPPPCPTGCHTTPRALSLSAAIDAGGQPFAAWTLWSGSMQAVRFSGAGATAIPSFLAVPRVGRQPRPVVDARGNGTVLWIADTGVVSSRWLATPAAPQIATAASQPSALTIAFLPPVTAEAAFLPGTYDYSLDDGASWTARVPASAVSPMIVSGLVSGAPARVRLRAVNGAGAGAPSVAVTATAGPIPGPPESLAVTALLGGEVTLSWLPPANSAIPTSYVIEAGAQPGQVLATIDTGTATTLTVVAPPGAYFVRARAIAAAGISVVSNEVRVFVDVPVAPSAPAHVLGTVDGSTLALSWTNTFGGGAPDSLWLVVGGSLSGAVALPLVDHVAFAAVPSGTYTVQVVAVNGAGISLPSPALTLAVPSACTGVPGSPTRMVASHRGSVVTVAWSPPDAGGAVTGYTVAVAGRVTGAVTTIARAVSGAVPSGTYDFTVTATNTCGASAATPPARLVVP